MDVFGNRWSGYTEKIKNNWNALVRPDDTVVLPGDISWAMHLADAKPDFDFLESLPGEKIISKGNHDFWWETTAKLERFCRDNNYTSFRFLHNNAYLRQGYIICGSRGWYTEDKKVTARNDTDAQKIIAREVGRASLPFDFQSPESTSLPYRSLTRGDRRRTPGRGRRGTPGSLECLRRS